MAEFKPRPSAWVPIGQQWADAGKEMLADLSVPTPCPVCGTNHSNCGVDPFVQERQEADRAAAAAFEEVDAERAEARRVEDERRIAADPDYQRRNHW